MSPPPGKYDSQHRRNISTASLDSDIYVNNDEDDNNSNSLRNRPVTESEDSEWVSMELFEAMPPPYSVFPGAYPEASASRSTQPEHPPQSLLIRKEDAQERKQQELQPKSFPTKINKVQCVVCKQDIVEIFPSSDNHPHTITCGKRCQQSLQAVAVIPSSAVMRGRMTNPHTLRFGPWNGINPTLQPNKLERQGYDQYSKGVTAIAMCEVCNLRPKCQRGGKTYPTCGLTCAAKLQSSEKGAVDMCEYCRKRPKLCISGGTYPHCGRTCRDKALVADAAAKSASCATCLVCWIGVPIIGSNSDFCSEECKLAVENRAPLLIELPRGHKAFKKVENVYGEAWKKSNAPRNGPRIKKIYMVQMNPSQFMEYEKYSSTVVSSSLFKKNSDMMRVWIGIVRTSSCGFGEPGNTKPCHSKQCFLCSLVRSDFNKEIFHKGIKSTLLLHRAVDQAFRSTVGSKLVLLADVVLGKVEEKDGVICTPLTKGYNSVHRIEYSKLGDKVDLQEYVAFDGAAVNPLYIISLE